MKILLVARGNIDSEKLIGNFELDQAIALKKCNIDVKVIAIDVRRRIVFSEGEKKAFNYMGIEINCYKLLKIVRLLPFEMKLKVAQFKMMKCFKEITHDWMPDIIHAHFGDVAYMILKVKGLNRNIPFVITEHYSLMNSERPNKILLNRMIKTYNSADKLICVSNSFRDNLKIATKCEFEVLPNLLDPVCFDQIKLESNSNGNKIKIISAGNYTENKNFKFLLEVISLIKDINFELDIYGSGKEENNIRKKILELELSKKIRVNNRLSRKKLIEKYLSSDIFILLSKKETFGVVYIEAMACGLPVISMSCGGTDDIINAENGIIIESTDKTVVAERIREVLKDLGRFNRKEIAQSSYEKYGHENIIRKQLQIYRDIVL